MYASAQDFIDHFGTREAVAISDRDGAGAPVAAELERLITLASEEVDGYVGRRYALPLTTRAGSMAAVPAPLKVATLNVARYHGTGTEILATDDIRDRYRATVKWLDGVASGTILLGNDLQLAAAGGAAPTGGASAVRTGGRMFGDGLMGEVI